MIVNTGFVLINDSEYLFLIITDIKGIVNLTIFKIGKRNNETRSKGRMG